MPNSDYVLNLVFDASQLATDDTGRFSDFDATQPASQTSLAWFQAPIGTVSTQTPGQLASPINLDAAGVWTSLGEDNTSRGVTSGDVIYVQVCGLNLNQLPSAWTYFNLRFAAVFGRAHGAGSVTRLTSPFPASQQNPSLGNRPVALFYWQTANSQLTPATQQFGWCLGVVPVRQTPPPSPPYDPAGRYEFNVGVVLSGSDGTFFTFGHDPDMDVTSTTFPAFAAKR